MEDNNILIETTYDEHGNEYKKTWVREKYINKGHMARVYILKNQDTNEYFAGKIISKEKLTGKQKNRLRPEIRIHKQLNHDNIVKFVSFFETPDSYVIVLELCSLSLLELIKSRKRLTENEVRYYIKQIIEGLKYLHDKKIIHRDLKLGNIFLTEDLKIKLGDFGLSTQLSYDGERKNDICGTPNYIAPEVLHPEEVGYSYSGDIWAIGVILYILLIGRPPFETSDTKATYRRIKDCIYYFPETKQISEQAKNLIKRILINNVFDRPTLDDILNDAFFIDNYIPTTLPKSAIDIEPIFNESKIDN